MANKKFVAFMASAAAVSGLIGCGGGGSSSDETLIPFITEEVPKSSSPITASIPASTTETDVTVVVDGLTGTAVVPPSTTATPAGSTLGILEAGVDYFPGLELGTTLSRAPGDIRVNESVLTRVVLGNNGRINRRLGLPNGLRTAEFTGPFVIRGNAGRRFTFQTFRVTAQVTNGTIGLPRSLNALIPFNGGTTRPATGAQPFVRFDSPSGFNGNWKLTITKSNGNLVQTQALSGTSRRIEFRDLFAGANATIPTGGADLVWIQYIP